MKKTQHCSLLHDVMKKTQGNSPRLWKNQVMKKNARWKLLKKRKVFKTRFKAVIRGYGERGNLISFWVSVKQTAWLPAFSYLS